jgi:hypothetical protein
MADVLPYLQPGNIPFGTRILTISSQQYICEDFNLSAGTTEIARKDNLNNPNGFVLTKNPRTATGTLQLATTATPIPGRGQLCTVTEGVFVTTTIGQPEQQGKLKVVSVTFRENI